MKRIVFISCIAFISFIAVVSCGGEEPKEPVDNDQNDEEVIVDNEESDDATDNEESDDIVDSEEPDDDSILTDEDPDQDQGTPDPTICSTFEPDEGTWYSQFEGDLIYETERAIDENGDSYCIVYTAYLGGDPFPWYSYDNQYPLTIIVSEEEHIELQRQSNQLIVQDYYKGKEATKMVWSR